jgi:hypothetical protein
MYNCDSMKRLPSLLLLLAMFCQSLAGWVPLQLERQVQSLAQVLEHGLMVDHHHHEASAVHHDSTEADRSAHLHPSEGFQTIALEPESTVVTAQLSKQPRARAPDDLFRSAALPRWLKPPRVLLQV